MKAKYATKDETKENFWKAMFDFRAQQDQIRFIDWKHQQKQYLIDGEVDIAKNVESMKQ